jgi:hypothetical protein
MKQRTALAMSSGVALLLRVGHRPSAANALLIELEARAGTIPAAVSANNVVVVGGLAAGGGFYWMPTTNVIFNGGVSSEDVSADGRTIVVFARDAGGIIQAGIWIARTEWRLLGSFSPTAAPCGNELSEA